MLAIFSGGSGAGKNTIIERLIELGGYALLPTYTTRGKRAGESDGKPYFFIDEETFRRKIGEGEFYEYENVHGNLYGTSRRLLAERLTGGLTLLKDIDVIGTRNLAARIGGDTKLITVFVKVASVDVLRERLTSRGETDIDKRLSRYQMEVSHEGSYDYILQNDDLPAAVNAARIILETEKSGRLPESTVAPETISDEETAFAENLLKFGGDCRVRLTVRGNGLTVVGNHALYFAAIGAGKCVPKEIVYENNC